MHRTGLTQVYSDHAGAPLPFYTFYLARADHALQRSECESVDRAWAASSYRCHVFPRTVPLVLLEVKLGPLLMVLSHESVSGYLVASTW